jgi:hypothetical protein
MEKNPEFRRTILIGLGGAGQLIALRTKRYFLDTFGVLPPSVKILCLDTDTAMLPLESQVSGDKITFDPDEYMHIKVEEPVGFIEKSPEVKDWFILPAPVGSITAGAGAVRQNGRMAFFRHINEIERRFSDMETQLSSASLESLMEETVPTRGGSGSFRLSDKTTEIYVCGSLAGGTGSGTFLDTGFLLRNLFPNAVIHGFFLLNWIYRNKPFAYRVASNVYAALSELDNFQSVVYGTEGFYRGSGKGPYTVKYGTQVLDVGKSAPYTLVHLIDGRNELGENFDKLDDLTNMVANAISLSMSDMAYPVASAVDNLIAAINVSQPDVWDNRFARYSSVGVSSIHYPARELFEQAVAQGALKLCEEARSRVENDQPLGEVKEGEGAVGINPAVKAALDKVKAFLNEIQLDRAQVRGEIKLKQKAPELDITEWEVTEPDFPQGLNDAFGGSSSRLETALNNHAEGPVQVFIAGLEEQIRAQMMEEAKIDLANQNRWIAAMRVQVSSLLDEVNEDLKESARNLEELEETCSNLLDAASGARIFPLIGAWRTPRGKAVKAWLEKCQNLFEAQVENRQLQWEQAIFRAVVALLDGGAAGEPPKQSDILRALEESCEALRRKLFHAERALAVLRKEPNHVLLANGKVTLRTRGSGSDTLEGAVTSEVDFERFVSDCGLTTPERFMALYREDPQRLLDLFLDHSREIYSDVPLVTVDQALRHFARENGDEKAFITKKFEDLFRYSAALWRYDKSEVHAKREARMGNCISVGLADKEYGEEQYKEYMDAACAKYHIIGEPSLAPTGDTSRIWLLNFSAPLPAFAMSVLKKAKSSYLDEIMPTFHIDQELEMNLPDLFPPVHRDNTALMVLGMAIVPGIDIIHDEKKDKGHSFTCELPAMMEKNSGQPKKWGWFLDMYDEIRSDFDEKKKDNKLDILQAALKEKVNRMINEDRKGLKDMIDDYCAEVQGKIDRRKFSRLISARLTYREITALKKFTTSEAEGGYDFNLDKYLGIK